MGTISRANSTLAFSMILCSSLAPRNASSVLIQRSGMGATLPSAMRHVVHRAFVNSRRSGQTDLRYRLRFSSAHLAIVVMQIRPQARQANACQQLVRLHDHFLVARVKTLVRHPSRAAHRKKFQLGVVGQQGRRRVGRRRSVCDVTAKRAAVLNGEARRFRLPPDRAWETLRAGSGSTELPCRW